MVDPIVCPGASVPSDDIEFTTTGGTSLRYDFTAGQFIQNWKTPKEGGSVLHGDDVHHRRVRDQRQLPAEVEETPRRGSHEGPVFGSALLLRRLASFPGPPDDEALSQAAKAGHAGRVNRVSNRPSNGQQTHTTTPPSDVRRSR